jgi:hypothetical protein
MLEDANSKVEVARNTTNRPLAGLLVIRGLLFFIAGAIHPAGHQEQDFKMAIVSMLSDKMWPIAHWSALLSAFIIAWSLFLLLDQTKKTAADAIRLGIISTIFMAMEFCVELAAPTEVSRVATDGKSSLLSLIDVMQAAGWPFFALAFILLAINTRWTPVWVRVAGVIGACALAIGGLVVQGLHVVALGPVFIFGNALAFWMVWAGIRIAVTSRNIIKQKSSNV